MNSLVSLNEAYGGYGIQAPPKGPRKGAGAGPMKGVPNGLTNKQKKTLEELTSALPISKGDEEDNFQPSSDRVGAGAPSNLLEGFEPAPWTSMLAGSQHGALSDSDVLDKLNRVLRLLEDRQVPSRGEPAGTSDVILYTATGIFLLFVMDTMVNLGRKIRRF